MAGRVSLRTNYYRSATGEFTRRVCVFYICCGRCASYFRFSRNKTSPSITDEELVSFNRGRHDDIGQSVVTELCGCGNDQNDEVNIYVRRYLSFGRSGVCV